MNRHKESELLDANGFFKNKEVILGVDAASSCDWVDFVASWLFKEHL